MNVPFTVGVPLMVTTFVAQLPEMPDGKPVTVAPVVVWVTFVIAVLTHTEGDEEATPDVLTAVTVIVPVALTDPQPPVNGIL